jgi:hypothetical protein
VRCGIVIHFPYQKKPSWHKLLPVVVRTGKPDPNGLAYMSHGKHAYDEMTIHMAQHGNVQQRKLIDGSAYREDWDEE